MTINSANTVSSSVSFTLVTRQWCQPCQAAKNLLSKNNIDYLEIKSENLTHEQNEKLDAIEYNFYPQIYRWGEDDISKESFVWGYQELEELSQMEGFQENTKNNINNTLGMNSEFKTNTDQGITESAIFWAASWTAAPLALWLSAWASSTASLISWTIGWVAATAIWVLLQKKSKNPALKAMGEWAEVGWIISTSVLWAISLGFTSTLATIASGIWIALTMTILLGFLTWRYSEAKRLATEKLWDLEKADALMKKIEEAWGDDLKEEIKAKAEAIIDDMKEKSAWDKKEVIRV